MSDALKSNTTLTKLYLGCEQNKNTCFFFVIHFITHIN